MKFLLFVAFFVLSSIAFAQVYRLTEDQYRKFGKLMDSANLTALRCIDSHWRSAGAGATFDT
jgi:hypothetical protein